MRFFWNRAESTEHEVILIDGNSLPRSRDPQWAPPGLVAVRDAEEARWVREAITTFGANVASFLPGHYEGYARVFHPFDDGALGMTWRALAALHGRPLEGAADGVDLAFFGVPGAQARVAVMPRTVVEPLLEHLRGATDTPDDCRFAVWNGRQSAISHRVPTVLHLPAREYYLFAGPIDGARASYDGHELGRTTANLWWPEDRAWFVATEIDFAWTYVGGTRACIDAILADPRLDAEETTAASRW